MPHLFLHAPGICPASQHAYGEALPQRVRADGRIQASSSQVFVEFAADTAGAKPLPMLVCEQNTLITRAVPRMDPAHVQVFLNACPHAAGERHSALLTALATDTQRLGQGIKISDTQVH